MHFEVPQFIEVEDKIFGPFTWRQFLYLGGGIGMAVVILLTTNFFVFILIGLPLGILAGALAFYPVNNWPFSFFLEAIFNYASKQRLYLWRQKTEVVHKSEPTAPQNTGFTAVSVPPPSTQQEKKDISSLARKLELQAMQKSE